MRFESFLAAHPVFIADEFALQGGKNRSRWTRKSLLAYHRKRGHIVLIRRGLYAAVPLGSDPDTYEPDPYLVASKMADDAVLAYHTALEAYGRAHSVFGRFLFLTRRKTRAAVFRSCRFAGIHPPSRLIRKHKEWVGVGTIDRSGVPVRVTCLERTLVDLLDRPGLGGGWEEIWRSLESIEFFDLGKVVEYALLLGNATTAAKVGFFLEQHREPLMVEDRHLQPLKRRRPRRPHYMDRSRRQAGRLIADWNLVVPLQVAQRSWEEAS